MPRKLFSHITKITISFVISLVLGIIVVLIESGIDNMQEKNEIRETIRTQIQRTADVYRATHRDAAPEKVAQFVSRYVEQVLPEEVIAVPPASAKLTELQDAPLWSIKMESGKLQLFINPNYVNKETTVVDMREIVDGVLASFLIFLALLAYVTKSEQTRLERLLHDEERRRLTTALHEQEAFALLGHMTATLSHELRTPVATISNLVQSLPTRIGDRHFVERFIQISYQELERMQRLMDNLLIYGKDLKIDYSSWVDLRALINENTQRHALTVIADDIKCYGDKFYFDLLFANLLSNSAEAGASEVHVTLHNSEGEERALIEYRDDGKGFPTDLDLKSLLSPFVTTRSKGAGLGLYLADKIVRAHGGELELHRPDKGANFRIWLPAHSVKINR
ncbi:MAG: HAMP domain-containing histidine kinase [Gammaproteobacteria bacterium]|nr:HAMP domain-containing histidine kinase [Gammaproteobacteria bacterium]